MQELKNKVKVLQDKIKYIDFNMSNKLKPVDAKDWVDPAFWQYKNLVLNTNNIKINAWTDIYGLPKNKSQFTFTIKIQRLQNKKMAIGIVDSKLKTAIKPSNSQNQVYYHTGGYYWNGKNLVKQKNGSYSSGDYVTVIIHLKNGTIQWRVNGQKKACIKNQAFKNAEIVWVPFVFMKEKDNSFSIFE